MSMPPPGQPQPNPTQGSSSPQAREARRIVGVTEYASDAQFVGAHAVQGRDALVAAARARLERVIAAHGAQSREAAVVDFELKSALSRLLPAAAAASPASQVNAPAAPKPPASVASVETAAGKAPAPAARPALRGTRKVDLALALYALRPAIGRAMLGARMRAGSPAHPQPAAIVPQATPAPSQSLESISTSTGQVGEQMQPSLRLRRRSRVRAIAVTVAVLSALGLVIEVAYVPFHLQRLRAAQAPAGGDAGGQSANGSKETPAGQPAPGDQRQLSPSAASASQGTAANAGPTGQASAAQPGSAVPAQGDAPAQVAPSGGSASTAGRSIPAPVIPFDATSDAGLPAAPVPEQVDPALRERRDMLAARWAASVEASLEATRAAGAMRPGMPRWLAEARLLERMVALDDVAQMLIDVRLDDAASLIEVVPARFALEEPAARDSERAPAREDGRLAGDLSRAGGGGEARLAVLRAYRSIPVPPGRTDARTLVSEAIGGPSRNARAIALAILLERGADSAEVLEAMHARAQDLLNAPAIRPVMLQLVGLQPGDVTQDPQELRALLARRILQLRGGPHERLDAVARSMEATLERMARRADPQAAPADMESSIATLARAASRDAGPPRTDAAAGPLQRLAASLESLLRARVTRNHRRIPGERAVVDAAAEISAERAMRAAGALEQSIALAAGILSQDAILLNLRPAWIGDAASRDAAAAAASAPPGATGTGAAAAAGDGTADPLMWPLPTDATLSRWPRAQAALAQEGGDAAQLMRMAEDIEDSSASPEERALAARLYARAGLAGDEAMAASAARAIAALVPAHAPDAGAQRHRWESIAAQYAAAASLARGRARSSARLPVAASFEADLSARRALADALAMCIAGQGRAALERLQSPAARALAQRLSAALPGGLDGLESLCASRIQQGAPMDRSAMEALLAMEAALRDPRSRRWSDDLALRQDAPLISIDSASAAERARIFGARE